MLIYLFYYNFIVFHMFTSSDLAIRGRFYAGPWIELASGGLETRTSQISSYGLPGLPGVKTIFPRVWGRLM